MPSSNLLSLFDDIAAMMDDVAVMTKKATTKTVGLIGDDLAVNSEQMIGLNASQELPVVMKIFWGALINKVILIPVVLLLSAFIPVVLKVLLFFGGLYLCFEGFSKINEKLFHRKIHKTHVRETVDIDKRVKGAIKTDFILSAEILAIAASTMIGQETLPILMSLIIIAVGVNIIIYGSVLAIIKIDDLGIYMLNIKKKSLRAIGNFLILASPVIMKLLGVIGTIATLLVGGGIILHTFHLKFGLPELLEQLIFGFTVGLFSFYVWGILKRFIPGVN